MEVACRLKKWSFSSQRTKDAASDNFRDNLKIKIIIDVKSRKKFENFIFMNRNTICPYIF